MKIGEVISVMLDNYLEVQLEEKIGLNAEKRYVIPRHSNNFSYIPTDVWEAKVIAIVPYYDRLYVVYQMED